MSTSGGLRIKNDAVIEAPGKLCVGGEEEFANVLEILHGQVELAFPLCAAGGIVSASAAITGIRTASPGTWRTFVNPASWGSTHVFYPASLATNGVITVTAMNPSASACAAHTATANFVATRTVS